MYLTITKPVQRWGLHLKSRQFSTVSSKRAIEESRRYVDTHTHIDMTLKKFQFKVEDFPKFAYNNFPPEWDGSIQICCDTESSDTTYKLINTHDKIWAAFGIHPHHATQYTTEIEESIIKAMSHPRTVAWGEMGLDYCYFRSPRDVQKDVFTRQIKCALTANKPLVIHTRDAEDDTFKIMNGLIPPKWPIHVHCFTSSKEFAEKLLKNWTKLYIGFTGVITFSSATDIHETVKIIPLERVLLETDAPYMSPHPFRGSVCHSGYIPFIANKISQLKKLDINHVYETTRKNTKDLYGI